MTTICSLTWPMLYTKHDLGQSQAVLEIEDYPGYGLVVVLTGVRGKPLVTVDGQASSEMLAKLGHAEHSLFQLNPGLREALLDRVRTYTLTRG
jgi:hypothetical protein